MATVNITTVMEVLPKFECLMQKSVDGESIYIRAKETMEAAFKDYNMNSADKAQIVANVIGTMSSNITAAAMQTALQWATREKELEIEKLKLAKELDLLDLEKELRDAQIDKLKHESIAIQVGVLERGTPLMWEGKVQSIGQDGKYGLEKDLLEEQILNTVTEGNLMAEKITETHASTHRIIADTLVNHGAWNYAVGANGFSSSEVPQPVVISGHYPLSDVQRIIAGEQAKGYAYNAWANSVTAAAGMIGTALASQGSGLPVTELATIFKNGVNKLQDIDTPDFRWGYSSLPPVPTGG